MSNNVVKQRHLAVNGQTVQQLHGQRLDGQVGSHVEALNQNENLTLLFKFRFCKGIRLFLAVKISYGSLIM